MESKELVAIQKVPVLEKGSYGLWKMKMEQIIKAIGEDAWSAVEEGWSPPTVKDKENQVIPKPKKDWTDAEKDLSKFNSRALCAIFNGVSENQFMRIQCCKSAKDAWDKLQSAYEGTSNVKTTRLDMLATRFEVLKMNESETIEEFSSKLSCIASEAEVLGKKYKDKRLVKKLLRSLPARFESKKTAMGTALDTDSMPFEVAVGHLQSYELEMKDTGHSNQMVSVANDHSKILKIEEDVALMTKRFKSWKNGAKKQVYAIQSDKDKHEMSTKKDEARCFECNGIGHFKGNCATAKKKEEIRCGVCKGFGHTRSECTSSKEFLKSYISVSESESDSDEDFEDGYVAFPAIIGDSETDTDSDVEDIDKAKDQQETFSFGQLYKNCLSLGKEKLEWLNEKEELTDHICYLTEQLSKVEKDGSIAADLQSLNKELSEENALLLEQLSKLSKDDNKTADISGVNKELAERNEQLLEQLSKLSIVEEKVADLQELNTRLIRELFAERERVRELEVVLTETMKKVKMLNNGTKDLDESLSLGCISKAAFGSGFNQFSQSEGTVMVRESKVNHSRGEDVVQNQRTFRQFSCFHCGKSGHIRRYCYHFKQRIQRILDEGTFTYNHNRRYQIWVPKDCLYERQGRSFY